MSARTSTTIGRLTLYDPREGLLRDAAGLTAADIRLGGVIHYIELDVNNLRRWLAGARSGRAVPRRVTTMATASSCTSPIGEPTVTEPAHETAEYGFEDFINPATAAGTPNNTLEPAEDVNGNGTREVYGIDSRGPTR